MENGGRGRNYCTKTQKPAEIQQSGGREKDKQKQDNRSSGLEIGPFRSLLICSRARSIQSLSLCVFSIVLSIFKALTQNKCQKIITKAEEKAQSGESKAKEPKKESCSTPFCSLASEIFICIKFSKCLIASSVFLKKTLRGRRRLRPPRLQHAIALKIKTFF